MYQASSYRISNFTKLFGYLASPLPSLVAVRMQRAILLFAFDQLPGSTLPVTDMRAYNTIFWFPSDSLSHSFRYISQLSYTVGLTEIFLQFSNIAQLFESFPKVDLMSIV